MLEAAGAEVHLAHPLGVKAFTYRRVKNDQKDAADLADLLRMGRLPEAWIAPHAVRELREITRYRHKLVKLRTSCKDQVHAVLAKLGIAVPHSDLFGTGGQAWLDSLKLPQPYAGKVTSLRQLTGELTTEITMLSDVTGDLLAGDRGYQVIQQLPGIGPVLAAVIVAEIGDVTRFRNAGQLCSWAGLTPRHRESDLKVARGHVTEQGSRMLRWALTEAIQRTPAGNPVRQRKDSIIARRGRKQRTSPRSPPPASCSPSSSTGCATTRSAAWPGPPPAPARRGSAGGMTSPSRGSGPGARPPSILPPARREAASYSAPRHPAGTAPL